MANELTRFLNSQTGGFGLGFLQQARASGLSDARIRELLPGSGIQSVGRAAAASLGLGGGDRDLRGDEVQAAARQAAPAQPPQPSWQPSSSNELTRFLNQQSGGFGLGFLNQARAAGLSDSRIRELLPGSGIQSMGRDAAASLGLGQGDRDLQGGEIYERAFQSSLQDYQKTLKTDIEKQVNTQLSALSQQSQQLQTSLSTAQKERDDAKARAEELEAQQKADREFAVNEQLSSLRSGSTAGGSPGAGLGSLQSGRPSYSVSNNASRGSVLDRAYKDIDPTDSVLDKNVAVEATAAATGATSSRARARERAMAAGGSASNYYARRFG